MMKKNTIELMSANTENLEKILDNTQEKDNLSDRVALIEEVTDDEYVLKAIDFDGNLLIGFKTNGEIDVPIGLTDDAYALIYALYEKLKDVVDSVKVNNETVESLESTVAQNTVNIENKQDKLSAGTGISIEDNIISCTFDSDLFVVVSELPMENISTGKIYCIKDEESTDEKNIYDEYLYVNGAWEMIGKYIPTVDMSLYETKEDAQEALNELEEKISEEYETKDDANASHSELQECIDTEISNREELIEETTDDDYVLKAVDASGDLLIGFKNSGEIEVPVGVTDDSYTLIYALYEKLKEVAGYVKESNENLESVESDIKSLKETKQDILSAGNGISIDDNVISSTIDTSTFETVESANASHSALEASINTEVEARESLIAEVDDADSVLKITDSAGNILQNFLSDGTCDITSGIPNGTYEVLVAMCEKMNEIAEAIKELKN